MFKEYKAETKHLMDMMVNSIYIHKDIFLRELISNASDALDKMKFISMSEHIEDYDGADCSIILSFNKEARQLIIEDNGIGMDETDLENNLGIIAKSGSFDFTNANKDTDLIGQFGVGFYSAFMVADKVTVFTRKYNSDQGYKWVSNGIEGYEISKIDIEKPGTRIILDIKEDKEEKDEYSQYLREYPIYKLVKKYSDYIRYPIKMWMPHPQIKEGSDPKNPEFEEKYEYEILNSQIPLWKKSREEITEEELNTYYKEHFSDKNDPLKVMQIRVDGNVSYDALLYVPSKPASAYDSNEYKAGLELYSNGVRIMDNCDSLLPEYYDFIKGIVETNDVSLNVSREILQQNSELKMIQKNLEKKIQQAMEKMLKDEREKYEELFRSFGKHLKVCAMENYAANQDKLQDLLLFYSANTNKLITLKEYTESFKEGQKNIYYCSGSSVEEIKKLPQAALLNEKGYDVLCFVDRVDELVASMFGNYHDFAFKSVMSGELEIPELNEKEKYTNEEEDTLTFVKEYLANRVDEVKLSSLLKDQPVLLSPGDGMTFEMEKYFHTMSPDMPMKAKKILKLNPEHESFRKLSAIMKEDRDRAKKYVEVLYQQSLLMAGLPIENPTEYTDLLVSLW